MPRTQPSTSRSTRVNATLAASIARSGMDEQALLRAATKEAFERITLLLSSSFADFSPEQQRRIRAAVGANAAKATAEPAVVARPKTDDAHPRFWLPHSGATWSGRGRAPQAFLAWEGTVAHTEWKKHHPGERFPKYPG